MRNLKRALSLGMTAAMISSLMVVGSSAASYSDVTSDENQEAIEVLKEVGIMVGDDNGNFNPDSKVTRNEMAVVMSNLMDYRAATYKGTSPFTDVPSWAEPYVAACYTNGITSGYTSTYYGGSDNVTTAQAALMLMKALGYFQYQSDFGEDWQFATTKKAYDIDLFEDVEAGVKEDITRNDLAQLVLNTLESGTVDAESDSTIKVGDITIDKDVKYNYVTSNKDYAKAISDREATSSTSSTKGYIVELGEKLYDGDLKKDEGSDEFERPANVWTYKSSEIGKYADSADGSWTTKVTEKALYNAAGSSAYDNYTWSVYQNGALVAEDGTNGAHAGRSAVINHSKNSSERVLTADSGVLTQVFVDDDAETVVVSLIDTGVAKVTKVTDAGDDEYEVTVSFKTKVTDGKGSSITPDTKYTTDQKFSKDDIVVYTASKSSGEIESMAKAQTVTGTVSAVKTADYATINGTTYDYNYAYTDSGNGFIGAGLYNIEDSVAASNPTVDKEATLYLDAYGYAVAFEGKTSTADDYLFVTDVGSVFDKDPSAKVVFSDGTEKTITVDKLDGNDATKGGNNDVQKDTVYRYTEGSSSYDLETVTYSGTDTLFKNNTADSVSIKKDNPLVAGKSTDNNTVFVDVENNKTWTGYKNVASKSSANVQIVLNKDKVAEVVFIYGDKLSGTAEDDDYIILKGTGYEAVKDSNNKTVYRFTDAYDINGNKLSDVYTTNSSLASDAKKGLYLVSTRNGDDYITAWTTAKGSDGKYTPVFALENNASLNASNYATTAKNGVLTLKNVITFGGSSKTTFAYNDSTTFVVVDLKSSGGVDTIRNGSVDDIEAYDSATGADNSDVTGVYVMTVDNENDDAPLAETVLVVVPYSGSTITPDKTDTVTGYSATVSAGQVIVTYTGSAISNVTEANVRTAAYNYVVSNGYTFNAWSGTYTAPAASGANTGLTIVGYNANNQLVNMQVVVNFVSSAS